MFICIYLTFHDKVVAAAINLFLGTTVDGSTALLTSVNLNDGECEVINRLLKSLNTTTFNSFILSILWLGRSLESSRSVTGTVFDCLSNFTSRILHEAIHSVMHNLQLYHKHFNDSVGA